MRAKKEFVVVAYDIVSDRRRRAVSKVLDRYGHRVNYSVYECMLSHLDNFIMKSQIAEIINVKEDSVVLYPICLSCYSKTETLTGYRESAKIVNSVD